MHPKSRRDVGTQCFTVKAYAYAGVLALLCALFLLWAEDIPAAELTVGAGFMQDYQYEYDYDKAPDDATSISDTAMFTLQGDLTENIKYGFSHTSMLRAVDADIGENILYLAYQIKVIKVVRLSAAIGVVGNSRSHRDGRAPPRENPVAVFSVVHPLGPRYIFYRATFVTAAQDTGNSYHTFYSGVEYKYDL